MDEFLHHYVEILSDPAHLAVEVTLMLLVDVLFLGMVWPLIKRHFHRDLRTEHQRIEDEHGLIHPFAQRDGFIEQFYPDPHEPYDYERGGL